MKIVVVGAGALGAYFGARWHEAGIPVQFLVRNRRANQLKENGLSIQSPQGDYRIEQPNLVEHTDEIEQADLVFLSVKSYHLNDSLFSTLKKLVNKGAKVLPVLNGITHIDALQQKLGEEAVLGGLIHIISTLDENGNVVHSSEQHDLTFGALHPSQHRFCRKLQRTFEAANMNSIVSDEILLNLWLKYTFINAFSGVTTAGDLNIGTIRKNNTTLQLGKSVLNEMKDLSNAYDVRLTDEHVEKAIAQIHRFPGEATSSMHRDKEKGLPLEVEHLLGGAMKLAEHKGVQVPSIKALYALIKPYENGPKAIL
ncbi:ketopantoate reductase family protein [Alkalihalobacillus sp. AL-G]|uniref:ketopantoate reductase family protein n=1 Tax=Alkalihalobacillus sp. AL-G TaxID=2926399 RepID=UPI00272B16F3|nr:ketopantoate reductase family protein [Alkalihalobacillus sp. AL-G]WLD93879.1 ketopantoate reductase family protein [Alkalihalobacillus sp. AL-G]